MSATLKVQNYAEGCFCFTFRDDDGECVEEFHVDADSYESACISAMEHVMSMQTSLHELNENLAVMDNVEDAYALTNARIDTLDACHKALDYWTRTHAGRILPDSVITYN